MEAKFKIGDLVVLNEFGTLIMDKYENTVALIVSGPYNMVNSTEEQFMFSYWSYDLMFSNNLITIIPQEFLLLLDSRQHEKSCDFTLKS